jgi:hypothetical protein
MHSIGDMAAQKFLPFAHVNQQAATLDCGGRLRSGDFRDVGPGFGGEFQEAFSLPLSELKFT